MKKKKRLSYDLTYKNLFSNVEMVASLVRDFVSEGFVDELDFTTWKRCHSSYVTADFRKRHNDIVWSVMWKKKQVYIYILLEFQRKPYKWMAVRVLNYISLLWLDLIKSGALKDSSFLPPVFPIVLYNGSTKWHSAVDLTDLIPPLTGSLAAYQPSLKYFLLEENSISDEVLKESKSIAALLMRLERADPGEALSVFDSIQNRLSATQHNSLLCDFTELILLMFCSEMKMDKTKLALLKPEEVRAMLAERITQWENRNIEKGVLMGREEGMTEGISIGRTEGISIGEARGESKGVRLALLDLLEIRFGVLPDAISSAVSSITDTQKLRNLTRSALQTASLEAFLEEVKKSWQKN